MSLNPFQCQITDYLEAAIVLNYELTVHSRSLGTCRGVAVNLRAVDGKEQLILRCEGNDIAFFIDDITQVSVENDNALFAEIPHLDKNK